MVPFTALYFSEDEQKKLNEQSFGQRAFRTGAGIVTGLGAGASVAAGATVLGITSPIVLPIAIGAYYFGVRAGMLDPKKAIGGLKSLVFGHHKDS